MIRDVFCNKDKKALNNDEYAKVRPLKLAIDSSGNTIYGDLQTTDRIM